MQDLTSGSLNRHLLKTTSFMLVMMVFQTLYFLIDLYWVGKLGSDAVAAVGIAGNISFLSLALTQMLGVGTTTVVSHAAGRKEHDEACLMFNQAQVLSAITGVLFLVVCMIFRTVYAREMSADTATAALAGEYLLWFIPAMALQFAMVAMGAALRGVGNFKPTMIVATATVILNMVLAPILIFGWLTGRPFGVAGAAVSSLIAVAVGVVWMAMYFFPRDSYLRFMVADWKPRVSTWKRILAIGLPSGFEFVLMALYIGIVYSVSRPFGPSAQAGFGIGGRIVQAGFMPIVALGFAVAPVAGQNFGARSSARVRETFKRAALMASGVMLVFTILCHIAPVQLVDVFSDDRAAIEVGEEYLRIISLNYIASGLIFVNSSMFQAMGNTIPSLLTSSVRILLVAIPVILLAQTAGFDLTWVWWLSVLSVFVQLVLSMYLLRREFGKKLNFEPPAVPVPTIPEPAVPA